MARARERLCGEKTMFLPELSSAPRITAKRSRAKAVLPATSVGMWAIASAEGPRRVSLEAIVAAVRVEVVRVVEVCGSPGVSPHAQRPRLVPIRSTQRRTLTEIENLDLIKPPAARYLASSLLTRNSLGWLLLDHGSGWSCPLAVAR